MSPHPEPTVLSRVSCRLSHLNVDRFHQPCLFSWAHTREGEDCHSRSTWRPLTLAGSSVLPPLRLSGGFFHADWTVPRQDVNSPFLPPACATPSQKGVCTHAGSGPSRVRRRMFLAYLGDPNPRAAILGFVAETATVSLRTLAFFFPLVKDTFSSFIANDSLSTLYLAPDSILSCLASKFCNFTMVSTFDCEEPMSSDESRCRTIAIRFCVVHTHVSSICTDFPRFHRMEFLSSMIELRPISYPIPECCHHEE